MNINMYKYSSTYVYIYIYTRTYVCHVYDLPGVLHARRPRKTGVGPKSIGLQQVRFVDGW